MLEAVQFDLMNLLTFPFSLLWFYFHVRGGTSGLGGHGLGGMKSSRSSFQLTELGAGGGIDLVLIC